MNFRATDASQEIICNPPTTHKLFLIWIKGMTYNMLISEHFHTVKLAISVLS